MARVDPRNKALYWNHPRVAGLSCLCADFTDHAYSPHAHDALVVAVTEAGGSEFRSRGEVHEAATSVLLVFNPAEPHSGRMARSRRWRYRGLYLDQAALATLARLLGIAAIPRFTSNLFRDNELIEAFLALHRALQAGTDALLESERLVDGFGRLFRRHGSRGQRIPTAGRDRRVFSILEDLVRERYAQPLTLRDLGCAVDLTPFQLIGLFKQNVGLTPHAYLVQVRLRAAMATMREGAGIAEAASAAGFYDQSALTRHFKRSFGITPLQWTRAQAGRPGLGNFDQ